MRPLLHHTPIVFFVAALAPIPLRAMTVTGYSSAANDRYSSGYPSNPVDNTAPGFVGAGLDWSGVGWAAVDATKSFGFLSPQHYLAASHYGGAPTIVVDGSNGLVSGTQTSVVNTGQGIILNDVKDTSIGTLTAPLPASAGIARYAVLDLNTSSSIDSPSNYNNLPVLLYGRGPNSSASTRIAQASIDFTQVSGTGSGSWFRTTRNQVQLEAGDSGSPTFSTWLNPAGNQELTLLGLNSAIDTVGGYNYMSFIGNAASINALNATMGSSGFALRVVGTPSNTWVGTSNTSITNRVAWGLGPGSSAPSDKFVNFNAATAGSSRAVSVDNNHNLRGLYFLPTESTNDGFTVGGASTLTIGRGGVTNYDNSRQVFNASLILGDTQYWNGGSGGVTVNALNTNGKLLEITGTGLNRITGAVSGTGSIAVSGGILEMTGANTYNGNTWVHQGTLVANNSTGSATGTGTLRVAQGATLAGAGFINSSTIVSGVLSPGNSIGTLTVANDVTWNAGYAWVFELGLFASSLENARLGLSTQDQLHLTGVGSDFLKGSGSGWTFDFAMTGENGWYRLVDWDGSSTFNASDFSAINLATNKTANFFIDETSSALYLNVIPEPSSALMAALSLGIALRRRRS